MIVPTDMRAAVLGQPGQIAVASKPVPQPGSDEVLVRVHRASLCGTDVKILNQTFFKDVAPAPGTFTPGHEYAGTVVSVGSTVDEFKVGDRVVAEAHRGCMRCENCQRGKYTDCLNYGDISKGHRTQGMTVDGGFAEYVVNPVSTLHAVPESVSFDEAVLLTTVGTVMHAFDVLGTLVVGARVAVIGPGPIGLLAVQVARELGCSFVALAGTRESRLTLGKQFGADLVVNARERDASQAVRAATNGVGVDVVLECSGAGDAVDTSLKMLKRGGTAVLVGFFDQPVTANLNHAVMNGINILTVRGEGNDSVRRGAVLAAQGRLNLAPLITHHVPLTLIDRAFSTYISRGGGALKVVIDVADA